MAGYYGLAPELAGPALVEESLPFTPAAMCAGAAIASHPGIGKVAFTGSTTTGQKIMAFAASNTKNITLETGGKSPLLMFNDADLDQAVKWAHVGIMSNQGQICSGTSRILVQEDVYEQFIAAFREYTAKSSKVGDQFGEDISQGPQISKTEVDQVMSYILSGVRQGARLVLGGTPLNQGGPGFFILPTIFADVTDDMIISREEIFSPVVVISAFGTEGQAIIKANNSVYGLECSIFTQNIERAHQLARRTESGTVWITSTNDSDSRTPFGGVKQSGSGKLDWQRTPASSRSMSTWARNCKIEFFYVGKHIMECEVSHYLSKNWFWILRPSSHVTYSPCGLIFGIIFPQFYFIYQSSIVNKPI
ncbi:ALDH-like protein [Aspergillus eucalypticola CBS 122712]|uniref:aldehyde dehydrogenase (NAD(+)) n=1 Tax=Aspergillus eucalypticola (strain CBS 122712 / IBT 29274) TaxID=1448314 RepID=A0A317V6N3_ASPEC|nr:ALDH-like protein [Aspergillus eucalypticola CBS 122712]PWY68708.1 ALDH-like protein [Aspergillus eucalypticola CBS 122712]